MTTAQAGTLADALTRAAAVRPDAPATILPRGRRHRPGRAGFRVTTYAELDRRSDVLAAGLTAMGIVAGVRTAFLVPPGEDFFALAFALLKAGAVPVLVDPGIGARNIKTCLGEVAPEAFIGVPRAHVARRVLRWCPSARLLVTVGGPRLPGGGRSLRAVERAGAALLPFGAPFDSPVASPDAVAAIAFTSGSTGVPKGVEYRHRHLSAQVRLIRELYAVAPGEVNLATFPPFALIGPALGMTTVIPRMDPTRPARVDPRRVVDAANTFGATMMFGSPALLDTVGRWAETSGASMPTVRTVLSAGAPVSRSVQRRFLAMLGPDAQVHTPYGATEALPVTSIGSREVLGLDQPGICVGRPAPGVDLAVIDISDEPVRRVTDSMRRPDGLVGEIVVRGPNVTDTYAERPAATALAKTDWDGQLAHRMGDLGYLDGAGRVWFCGRKAHRVTTVTGTMFSVPCEEVFNAHPAVRRSALVGVGAPGRQRPVICVELERGVSASPALSAALFALATRDPLTETIGTVLYHCGFPVDIRHNAKIDRGALAVWAARRLR
ncbi:MAG: AMP-binding protein [Acidothermales bacterium]|nr:AMP-binding protein [Acidothermales bacterium]